jgi:heme a synthase
MLKALVNGAIVLAMLAIVLGAYTRLTHAGLGCPDWPGCYGAMSAPKDSAQVAQAQEKFPHLQVVPYKARNEMVHRYIAGLLGVSILLIFLCSQWQKRNRLLSGVLLLLVVMQAALGMWTVTLQLMPLVVLGHLLGGFSVLSLLVLLRVKMNVQPIEEAESQLVRLIPVAWLALVVLMLQISLGAWTSSNYAALACHQLPICESGWQERFNLSSAMSLPLGQATYEFGVLSHNARLSIHVLHRVGAFITFVVLGSFAVVAWWRANTNTMRRLALGLVALLILQLCLGLINVIAYLPLANAVAHNVVAANLLMLLVIFIYQLYFRKPKSQSIF